MIFTPCMHDYSIKVHCLSLLRYKYNGTCSYIKANLTWAYQYLHTSEPFVLSGHPKENCIFEQGLGHNLVALTTFAS